MRTCGSVIRYEYADAGDIYARPHFSCDCVDGPLPSSISPDRAHLVAAWWPDELALDGLESGCDRWRQPDPLGRCRSLAHSASIDRPPAGGLDVANPDRHCDTVCFGHGDHLMVFDVWDTIEEFDAFTATLMPILAIEHIDMAPPEPLEIHDLIDGGDSRALRRRIAELRDKAFFIRPVEKLREKLHSVQGKPSENQDADETPSSER